MSSNPLKSFSVSKLLVLKLFIALIFSLLLNSCSSSDSTYFDWCGTGNYYPLPMKVEISSVQYIKETDSLIIRGRMSDSTNFEPLIGSRIIIFYEDEKTILSETQTNIDGYFKIATKYSPSYIIEFSYIGYIEKNYELKDFIKQYFKLDSDQ